MHHRKGNEKLESLEIQRRWRAQRSLIVLHFNHQATREIVVDKFIVKTNFVANQQLMLVKSYYHANCFEGELDAVPLNYMQTKRGKYR